MDNLPLTRDLTAKRRRARVEWHRPSLQAVPPHRGLRPALSKPAARAECGDLPCPLSPRPGERA